MFDFRRDAIGDLAAGRMTPAEVYRHPALWPRIYGRSPPLLPWQVKPYERTAIAGSVMFYSARRNAPTLIVAFTGRVARIFQPVAAVLQALDDRLYDMLLISDERQLHFDHGVDGYADSLPALAGRIERFARDGGYSGLVTYGTSVGALPALRAGALLKADRAIAAGPRFPWHVKRLCAPGPAIGAFDLICDCRQAGASSSFALFSEGNEQDIRNAAQLSARWPGCTQIAMPCAPHNFVNIIKEAGRLADYQREIFDLGRRPDPALLRSLAQ